MAAVTIIATFHPLEGNADAVRAELETMVQHTRREPGCLRYDLHVRANGRPAEVSSFVLVERYRNSAALDAHRAADYFTAYRAAVAPQLSQPIDVVVLSDLDIA